MKKRKSNIGSYFGVLLSFLTIFVLVGSAFYLTFYMSGKEFGDLKNGIDDGNETITIKGADIYITKPLTDSTHTSLLFVGDSRTQGMANALALAEPNDPCKVIARDGEGLSWLSETGSVELDAYLKEAPASTVVLNFGVNDLTEIDHYITYYQQLFANYPEATFYIMSVNPVPDDSIYVSNQVIDAFNQKMKAAFPDQYLDVYNYLLTSDFETVDGLHYTESTYLTIHYYVTNKLSQ